MRPKTAKIENKTGGVYDINFPGVGKLDVYCDTKTDGGGWTVSLHVICIGNSFRERSRIY